MAFFSIPNVAIKGVSACVPPYIEENKDMPFYAAGEAEEVSKNIGVERRHLVRDGITASDLCVKAAEELISKLGWEKDSIDLLVLVTQTPDYLTPPTAFIAHEKLGLSKDCMVVDFNHGCPGWVVALSNVASILSRGDVKRALLLDGDTVSMGISKTDRESRPLFGDAGTATALEFDEGHTPIEFNIGTNSKDGNALKSIHGGTRNFWTLESLKNELDRREGLVEHNPVGDGMDSMSVFSFGITAVPKSIKNLCAKYQLNVDDMDCVLLHQANLFMLKKIAKKIHVDMSKVPTSLRDYGNTTSVSIPMTIVTQCANLLSTGHRNILGCGFGTGLAWAVFHFQTEGMVCPNILTY